MQNDSYSVWLVIDRICESRISQCWGKDQVDTAMQKQREFLQMEDFSLKVTQHCYLFILDGLPGKYEIVQEHRASSHSCLCIIFSFSHSSIYVWVEAGHSRRKIWVPHSFSLLISHLLFMSVNILFYLMYICQRNVGLSSRQAYFPLPSWDVPELNSMSLHS